MPDQFGNYQANLGTFPPTTTPTTNALPMIFFDGDPTGSVDTYPDTIGFDRVGLNFWYNATGDSADWVEVSTGGGGGAVQVFGGSFADPNGHVTPSPNTTKAVYYKKDAAVLAFWCWDYDAHSWFQIIG